MLDKNEIQLIRELYCVKHASIREIARTDHRTRKTVGRWIANEYPAPHKTSNARQFLESYREEVEKAFLKREMNCRSLQRALQAEHGKSVSLRMLQRFCSEMRRL